MVGVGGAIDVVKSVASENASSATGSSAHGAVSDDGSVLVGSQFGKSVGESVNGNVDSRRETVALVLAGSSDIQNEDFGVREGLCYIFVAC